MECVIETKDHYLISMNHHKFHISFSLYLLDKQISAIQVHRTGLVINRFV